MRWRDGGVSGNVSQRQPFPLLCELASSTVIESYG